MCVCVWVEFVEEGKQKGSLNPEKECNGSKGSSRASSKGGGEEWEGEVRMRGVEGTDSEPGGLYTPTPSVSQTNTFFRTQTYFISTLYGRQEHFGHQWPHAPLKFPFTGRIHWRKTGSTQMRIGNNIFCFLRRQIEAEGTQHREIESRFSILRGELLNGRCHKLTTADEEKKLIFGEDSK